MSIHCRRLAQVLFLTCLFLARPIEAADPAPMIELTKAVVVVAKDRSPREQTAARMLIEEVLERTQIRWPESTAWPDDPNVPVIALGTEKDFVQFAGPYAEKPTAPKEFATKPEGYSIQTMGAARQGSSVLVIGSDARGVLFGVGRLLRELRLGRQTALLPAGFHEVSAPVVPLRGHQLGYRPKTNSYDAWSLDLWERYYRDLAVFGTNAVELVPPRSDDAADSPHFPLPPLEMMIGMSRLADDYGLDVWIWYPTLDEDDLSKPKVVDEALRAWGEVFEKLPRIDAVFVPSGDPGDSPPRLLMDLLEKQTAVLKKHHPKAQMWVSVQGYTKSWMADMLSILRDEKPAWLAGVGFGPQTRLTLAQLRKELPSQYLIRRYPDITHSLRCEFPVPNWDTAFSRTIAREGINPRPIDQATIFRAGLADSAGFITYSEGCNDDVNKMVWSALGWNPDAAPMDTLRQYGRYFIGHEVADEFALGLMDLERNWRGPLLTNAGVEGALGRFQRIETAATPQQKRNWRLQQALYRAYYDAYTRQRLLYETGLEARAMELLRAATKVGSERAMADAENALMLAVSQPVAQDLRARAFELAEALFQSIRMQLSVDRYGAIHAWRGGNLDTIDVPLNSRVWLIDQFALIRKLAGEGQRRQAIDELVHWTDPGPGGFYDDLGNPVAQPHLVPGLPYEQDPGFLRSPTQGFFNDPKWRYSWCQHADALYENQLALQYDDLDPDAEYVVRVVYGGDNFETKVKLVTDDGAEVHPYQEKPFPVRPIEFPIPSAATKDGRVKLLWSADPERGGAGRGCEVAEVWLIRKGS